MKLEVLSVYDSKARAFMLPFYSAALAVGVRSFATAVNTPGQQLYASPEDFTLFHLGSFDDHTGEFSFFHEHINLGMASMFKNYNQESNDVQRKVA